MVRIDVLEIFIVMLMWEGFIEEGGWVEFCVEVGVRFMC